MNLRQQLFCSFLLIFYKQLVCSRSVYIYLLDVAAFKYNAQIINNNITKKAFRKIFMSFTIILPLLRVCQNENYRSITPPSRLLSQPPGAVPNRWQRLPAAVRRWRGSCSELLAQSDSLQFFTLKAGHTDLMCPAVVYHLFTLTVNVFVEVFPDLSFTTIFTSYGTA